MTLDELEKNCESIIFCAKPSADHGKLEAIAVIEKHEVIKKLIKLALAYYEKKENCDELDRFGRCGCGTYNLEKRGMLHDDDLERAYEEVFGDDT